MWREYLPYQNAIDISRNEREVYCATRYGIFSVSLTDHMIERYSRITGLNGIGISKIQFDNATGKLVVAYDDSNIDILYRSDIINILDITRDNITGDKSIRQIHIIGDKYYLATGLGIIVLDAQRYEVSDTWLIGDGGNKVGVNAIANDVQYIYA